VNSERWFRRLLRLLPLDFRADYGRDMEQVFHAQRREAAARGRISAARTWLDAVADVLAIAPREHAAQLRQDVRYALRGMRSNPGFVLIAVVTLALGLGANTAMFSVAYAVLLRPLPYRDAARLVAVANHWEGRASAALSDPEYMDYAERTRTLAIAAMHRTPVNVTGSEGDAERLMAAEVTANTFDVLNAGLALGRSFRVEEEQAGAGHIAILSYRYWQRSFGGDERVVGRAIAINGVAHDIIGVTRAGFLVPEDFGADAPVEVILPLELDRAASRHQRGGHYLFAFARLAPGTDVRAARSEMDGVSAALVRQYPDQHDLNGFGITLTPLRTTLLGDAQPVIFFMTGAVGLVLLLACANVANLLLARGQARRRELAIRTALGASRLRIVRQLLTESCILSAAGAAAGLIVASWCQSVVVRFAPDTLPRAADAALNGPVLACAAGLALLTGVLFGIIPALQLSRRHVSEPLKDGARGTGSGGVRVRRALVVAQVGMAVVLLVGAGLLIKSFVRLMSVRSGFSTDRVLTLRISLPETRYPGRSDVTAYFERLAARLGSLPGVASAGAGSGLPLAVASGDWSFDVEGRPLINNKHSGAADWYAVTPGYFETLGIRVVRGRAPAQRDAADAPPVVFINETTARTLFPSEDPLGRRIRFSRSRGFEQPWRTIAGIVGDVRQRGLDTPPRPEAYFPHAQFQHFVPNAQARSMNIVLKTPSAPIAMIAAVRDEVRGLDPEVPAAEVHDMDGIVADSTRDRRLNVLLIGAFGGLALLLAAVGVYGVLAFQVAQRTREMGVRLALGASHSGLLALVLGEGMQLVALGLLVGLAAASALGGAISGLLFGVEPRDLTIFAAVPAVLLIAGALASYIPARRATHVDPVVALRGDG
jgi:predicted permease